MKNLIGNIYEGEVVLKEGNYYLVDIGIGYDTILNRDEATTELEVGDFIDVIVTHYVSEDYYVSMKGVNKKRRVEELEDLIGTDVKVSGLVKAYKNHRFIVDLGDNVKGSVYVKNMDIKFIKDGEEYVGKDYQFLIVGRANRGYEDFELNRRDLVQQEREVLKEEFLTKYHEGDIVEGPVVETMNAGIILDIDGIKCFIPRSEIAHYVLKELPKEGTIFKAIIKEVQERSLSLKGSIKELEEHPFEQAKDLKVGDVLKGKVSKAVDYGVFVELFDHVDGLVHISEVSYEHTKDLKGFEPGQELDVKVIGVDLDKKKIALSIKRLMPSPYEIVKENINVGDELSVVIKRVTENGLRVLVQGEYYTTILNDDIYDYTKVKPTLRVNDRFDVIVTELDDENEKLVLSNTEFVKKDYDLLDSNI